MAFELDLLFWRRFGIILLFGVARGSPVVVGFHTFGLPRVLRLMVNGGWRVAVGSSCRVLDSFVGDLSKPGAPFSDMKEFAGSIFGYLVFCKQGA